MSKRNEKQGGGKADARGGFGLQGLLDGFQGLMEMAAKLKEAGGEMNQTGEFSIPGLGEKGKGVFGFSVRTLAGGDSGSVAVKPFGNIHKTAEGMCVEEDREPVVDVFEEGEQIRVIAELPGASEADIRHELADDVLVITAEGSRRYHAEVLLPCKAEPDGIETSYKNGVLEVRLRKAAG